ncbi:hypothetical protein IFM89_025439 [Coptis chinensis]|uniref:Uncharacterized protein n=1 Tax=Coptis chinensis TaxID=261450 RepID=A0A835HNN7_9MAGN|nr:hypothetical protein IFM89_025439 [Coptis chinensis]
MWATVLLQEHPDMFQKAKAEQEQIVKNRLPTQKGLRLKEIRQMDYLKKGRKAQPKVSGDVFAPYKAHRQLPSKNHEGYTTIYAYKASTPQEFDTTMEKLKKVNQAAHTYLMDKNPVAWSRAFFVTHSTCEVVENNMCEVFNGTIVEARSKPIISMFKDIRMKLTERMVRRVDMMGGYYMP